MRRRICPICIPGSREIYHRKVERLAEALTDPDAHRDAAEAIRDLVERVTLTPGEKRGEMRATLHGDLATIVEWAEPGTRKNKTDTPGAGVSVSVVAGTCNQFYLLFTVQGLRPKLAPVSRQIAQ